MKKAQIIIFLVAENQESHLRILNDIMTIFSDKVNTDKIISCNSEKEVIEVISDILSSSLVQN